MKKNKQKNKQQNGNLIVELINYFYCYNYTRNIGTRFALFKSLNKMIKMNTHRK